MKPKSCEYGPRPLRFKTLIIMTFRIKTLSMTLKSVLLSVKMYSICWVPLYWTERHYAVCRGTTETLWLSGWNLVWVFNFRCGRVWKRCTVMLISQTGHLIVENSSLMSFPGSMTLFECRHLTFSAFSLNKYLLVTIADMNINRPLLNECLHRENKIVSCCLYQSPLCVVKRLLKPTHMTNKMFKIFLWWVFLDVWHCFNIGTWLSAHFLWTNICWWQS
jgi:hypothetical protein